MIDKLTSDSTVLEFRQANDKLLQFDRAFLVDKEIPGTMFYSKNILVSPSSDNLYNGRGFIVCYSFMLGRIPTGKLLVLLVG